MLMFLLLAAKLRKKRGVTRLICHTLFSLCNDMGQTRHFFPIKNNI